MSYDGIPSISNRHCLMLGLGRYLIVFDPLTLVLDQWKHNWQMRSQQHVLNRSKNFTSCCQIRMPPIIPTVHYRDFKKPIECSGGPNSVFHADVFNTWACGEHFNLQGKSHGSHTLYDQAQQRESNLCKVQTMYSPRGWTDRPPQISNYEHFNRNNFNIHYRSWNYRGCWHQTCPPIRVHHWY